MHCAGCSGVQGSASSNGNDNPRTATSFRSCFIRVVDSVASGRALEHLRVHLPEQRTKVAMASTWLVALLVFLLVNDAARSSLRLARLVGLLELKVPRPCCENRFLARCSLGSYDLCPSPSYAFSFVISLSFLGLVCIFIGSVRTSVASDR